MLFIIAIMFVAIIMFVVTIMSLKIVETTVVDVR